MKPEMSSKDSCHSVNAMGYPRFGKGLEASGISAMTSSKSLGRAAIASTSTSSIAGTVRTVSKFSTVGSTVGSVNSVSSERTMSTVTTGRRLTILKRLANVFAVAVALVLAWNTGPADAWGSSSNSDGSSGEESMMEATAYYGDSMERDWLYSASAISLQLEGCVWGYVYSHDDADCMENGSQDGTTYWYQMANCRRAQAVYRMYSTQSANSASCSNQNFQESFITTNGLSTFVNYISQYDGSSFFDDDNYKIDDNFDDDGGGNNKFEDIPNCQQSNNGYIGLACTDDGRFALQYFSDSYCLTPTGKIYDKLNSLNRYLNTFKKCVSIGSTNGNGNKEYTLAEALIATSASCSSLDSAYCVDSVAMQQRFSGRSGSSSSSAVSVIRGYANIGEKSWVTKLKYATGALLLLASFVMFTGILFTNRRRRRALMQRKYRQSRSGATNGSRKSRSSKSRTRGKSAAGSRSKSRARDSSTNKEATPEGYFT